MSSHGSNYSFSHWRSELEARRKHWLGGTENLHHLAAIDAALRRLIDGTFGRCIACAQPIGDSRLLVDPTATRCGECQSNSEARATGRPQP